jgi:hypothetical protein
MFLYLYGDYFRLYQPGLLHDLLQGKLPVFGAVTQGMLVGFSAMMAVPSVDRWLNIIVGPLYALIDLATLPGSWVFTIFLGVIEIALTLLVAWYAWRWPRT